MSNIVTVTEANNTVTVTPSSNKVTVTQSTPTITLSTPFSKVGAEQNVFTSLTDGSNVAEADNASDTFTFTGTSPITATVTAGTDTLTVAATDASTSAKGVASFASADFAVSSGAVSLVDLTTTHIASGSLDTDLSSVSGSDDTLASAKAIKTYVDAQDANIASDTLTFTNKTFDVEATGNSISNIDVADLKSGVLDTDISSVSGSDDTLPSAKATKTYIDGAASQATTAAQGVGTGNSPTFVNTTLTGALKGPASFTIDPATVGDNTGTVVIAGDLQVDGTTTTVNSTTLTVDDKNIELAHSPSGSVGDDASIDGGGITLKSSAGDKTILFNDTFNTWDFNQNVNMPSVSGTLVINNTSILKIAISVYCLY